MKPLLVLVQPETNILDKAKSLPTPPLSLLSAVRQIADRYEIALVDVRRGPQWKARLAELLAKRPVCVGVTSVTGNQILSTLAVTRTVKALSSSPVVWGGVHGTLFPDQVLSEPSVDVVVRGEGEVTFSELVDRWVKGDGLDGVLGVSFRRDNDIVHNPDRPFADLDAFHEAPYDILESPFFLSMGRPTFYLETSRGCFSKCTYCYVSAFHESHWRAQSAGKVLARLDFIRERWPIVTHLSLVDDNYFGKMARVRAISEGLIERGSPFTYQIQGAQIQVMSGLSLDDFRQLRTSGCVRLDMGLESGSSSIHRAIHKRLDLERVRAMNRYLGEVGITPWYNIMAGFPDETEDDMAETRKLVMAMHRENPGALFSPFYRVVPYPGTRLYEQALDAGFRAPASLEAWKNYHGEGLRVPWQNLERQKRISRLFFVSIFFDRKTEVYNTHPLLRWAAKIYRPIARYRLNTNRLRIMPEYFLFRRLVNAS